MFPFALAEDGARRGADPTAAEFLLEAEVEERRDDFGPDGKASRTDQARDEPDEVQRVEGGRRSVVLEEVDDGVEAELVTVIPALATEALHDDIHNVDGKIEVGLLADERAQAVYSGRCESRVLCEGGRLLSDEPTPITVDEGMQTHP